MSGCAKPLVLIVGAFFVTSLLACTEKPAHSSARGLAPTVSGAHRAPAAVAPGASVPLQVASERNIQVICAHAASAVIPGADQPDRSEMASLAECDAEALYYGIGSPPDFVVARRCAYAQSQHVNYPVIGGAGILMMVYANGRSVDTNVDLATM
jgi:hypothetical protein